MISIIICSRYKNIDIKLNENIAKTIGVSSYEIVWIDNSKSNYSIFEAYNEGVKRAQYNYLCFMHEDIIFHSKNWGKILIENLNYKNVGAVGIMGGYYLDHYSIYWVINTLMCGQLVHRIKDSRGEEKIQINNCQHYKELGNSVIALDGIWIGLKKDFYINNLEWDSQTYKGFHFYDMDISLQIISKGYKLIVLDNVLIEHKSCGNLEETFFNNCIKFHKKWDHLFPIMSVEIPIEYLNKAKHIQLKERTQTDLFYHNQKKIFNHILYKIATKLYLLFNNKHT